MAAGAPKLTNTEAEQHSVRVYGFKNSGDQIVRQYRTIVVLTNTFNQPLYAHVDGKRSNSTQSMTLPNKLPLNELLSKSIASIDVDELSQTLYLQCFLPHHRASILPLRPLSMLNVSATQTQFVYYDAGSSYSTGTLAASVARVVK